MTVLNIFFSVFNLVNTNSEETINNNVVDIQPIQIVNNQGVLNCIITHEEICNGIKNLKKKESLHAQMAYYQRCLFVYNI